MLSLLPLAPTAAAATPASRALPPGQGMCHIRIAQSRIEVDLIVE